MEALDVSRRSSSSQRGIRPANQTGPERALQAARLARTTRSMRVRDAEPQGLTGRPRRVHAPTDEDRWRTATGRGHACRGISRACPSERSYPAVVVGGAAAWA